MITIIVQITLIAGAIIFGGGSVAHHFANRRRDRRLTRRRMGDIDRIRQTADDLRAQR